MSESNGSTPRILKFAGGGGLMIEADVSGDSSNRTLILLHGGGQTRHAWGEAAAAFVKEGFHVIVPDLRGHGGSGWSEDGDYTLERHAEDLCALVADMQQPPIIVGASLGGLTTLIACGEPPHVSAAMVVLVDVAHRARPAGVSRIVSFMRARPDGFENIEEAAAAVAAYLPHRAAPPDINGLRRNLRQRDDGRWVWHWDPRMLDAISDDSSRMTSSERLLAAAKNLRAPLVLVRGAISDVVDEAIAAELAASVPGTKLVHVEKAGHMVAGDRNSRFIEALLPCLQHAAEPTN